MARAVNDVEGPVAPRRSRIVRFLLVWVGGLALATILAMAGLAAWDVVATRKFRAALAAFKASGEPVGVQSLRERPSSIEALTADRYYRAAATEVGAGLRDNGLLDRVREADRSGKWADALAKEARGQVFRYGEQLLTLDRAVRLPFGGLSSRAETGASYFSELARLAGVRTAFLVHNDQAGEATNALNTELRYRPVVEWAWAGYRAPIGEVERVGPVVSAARPPGPSLALLAAALGDLDRDDALKRAFVRQRAALVDSFADPANPSVEAGFGLSDISFRDRVRRLRNERRWLARLEAFAAVIPVLDQPWPARAGAVAALYDRGAAPGEYRQPDVDMARQIVDDLARIRAARVAVAVERYRRDHMDAMPERLDELLPAYLPALPVDPYSGAPVRLHAEPRGFSAYSIGSDGRDDTGDVVAASGSAAAPRDVGARIQLP